ncbi:MAG TPA: prepilin-type N-terminal cleavage/methylation domain-containing protein [Verrucomicrobiae bacterium]
MLVPLLTMKTRHPLPNPRAGFTFMEMMVAAAVSTVVIGAVVSALLFFGQSYAALGNYVDLNRKGFVALDQISREIRQASALKSFATNQLVFLDASSNEFTLAWNASTKQLTRSGGGATSVLLDNCDYLQFNISQRTPLLDGTFGFYSASNNPALCKLVSIDWSCSRTGSNKRLNTESVQTAKIVMRN